MNKNSMPQRGVDFDDYAGTKLFASDRFGLSNVNFTPIFCGANENHDDEFIGISYSGYRMENFLGIDGKMHSSDGLLIQGIIYPSKAFTEDDLERLFDTVETDSGDTKYVLKADIRLDEAFVRVCYALEDSERVAKLKKEAKHTLSIGELDNLKWVAVVDGGEAIVLHGDRRQYIAKDAEA